MLKDSGEWFGDRFAAEEADAAAADATAGPGGGGEPTDPTHQHPEAKKKAQEVYARVESIDTGSGEVVVLTPSIGIRPFKFKSVLAPTASQTFVYEKAPRTLIMDFLNGFNASIVVYGR